MERRDVLRTAILAAFGIAGQRYDALAQGRTTPGGSLTCALDQWQAFVFTYKRKQVAVPMAEVFAALEEAYGSVKK